MILVLAKVVCAAYRIVEQRSVTTMAYAAECARFMCVSVWDCRCYACCADDLSEDNLLVYGLAASIVVSHPVVHMVHTIRFLKLHFVCGPNRRLNLFFLPLRSYLLHCRLTWWHRIALIRCISNGFANKQINSNYKFMKNTTESKKKKTAFCVCIDASFQSSELYAVFSFLFWANEFERFSNKTKQTPTKSITTKCASDRSNSKVHEQFALLFCCCCCCCCCFCSRGVERLIQFDSFCFIFASHFIVSIIILLFANATSLPLVVSAVRREYFGCFIFYTSFISFLFAVMDSFSFFFFSFVCFVVYHFQLLLIFAFHHCLLLFCCCCCCCVFAFDFVLFLTSSALVSLVAAQ